MRSDLMVESDDAPGSTESADVRTCCPTLEVIGSTALNVSDLLPDHRIISTDNDNVVNVSYLPC